MKILVVQPGASYSTADVHNGIVDAMSRQGVDIVKYALDSRIELSGAFLMYMYNRIKKRSPAIDKPNDADIIYHAGQEIVIRALRFDVDWVFITSAMYVHPDIIMYCKRAGLKVAVLFTESPYDDSQHYPIAQQVDICWTNERLSVPILKEHNHYSYYYRHAYDPNKHYASLTPIENYKHDVVFVGTGFKERLDLLGAIDWDALGINLGLYGVWELMGNKSKLRKYLCGDVVDNVQTAELYRNSKIGLNIYRESVGFGKDNKRILPGQAESIGPRGIELAACGVFSISSYRAEVAEMFGQNIPTYTNAQDLQDKIIYYLNHPVERQLCAMNAYRMVQGETFDTRAKVMLQQMTDFIREGSGISGTYNHIARLSLA